jgi:XRE family transcriptional regulator, regulator of sulfur utilization
VKTDDFAAKIPKNLSSIRKQQRYTQNQVAAMAGLNPNYYAKIERGYGIPSLRTLYKIAKALNVSVSDIVGY